MHIPEFVIKAARRDFGAPEVHRFLASLCEKDLAALGTPGGLEQPPLTVFFAWKLLRQAHIDAKAEGTRKGPFQDPSPLLELLKPSLREQVLSAPPTERMALALRLLCGARG